jgi:small subunit ribosomal protein S1
MSYKPSNAQTLLIKNLAIGDIVDAKVIKITRTGVIVQYKIINGIIRFNDITYGRFTDIDDYVAINQKLKLKVLSIDENLQVQFGLKQVTLNPWQQLIHKYKPGMYVAATVVDIQEYGAFLSIADGIEGLLHKKNISDLNELPMHQYFKIDEVYQVQIIDIDIEKKRIALGLPED